MSKYLIIVESPAKAKTLGKYLGNDYQVLASYGHVRDLVPRAGAVDTENDFKMNYELIARNADHVEKIVAAAAKAEAIYLATDPDREGEAISWHLANILAERGVSAAKPVQRVAFHEITERAIKQALAHPRALALDLVDAQQARRALDFLVGFNLSPLLWRKVLAGLSAGRVQSPALRLIVEREREIGAFRSQEYWKITAQLPEFGAVLSHYRGEKLGQFAFTTEATANAALAELKAAGPELTVSALQTRERQRHPTAPFITSTLQQEAARKLHLGAQRTMRIAQNLYEAGHITYMRTDSVNLADEALEALRALIGSQYGAAYLPPEPRRYKTKAKNAQEAHEAIRPTDCNRRNIDGSSEEQALYDLIWKRTIASQMSSALLEQTSVDLTLGPGVFHASGSVIKFAGFMGVYLEDSDDETSSDEALLPALQLGQRLAWTDIVGSQHFTQPPPRFSDASLIKALELYGIGRPSTYASIISTLLQREYVFNENRRFQPSSIGLVVNDFLVKHFERYVDYAFTAQLEDDLDAISRGETPWKELLRRFWADLARRIEEKKDVPRQEVMQARELGLDPKSGKPVSVRLGRFGPFVQIGSKDDEEKPTFASIPAQKNMETLTLTEALALFTLPRSLGLTEDGEEMWANNGRFGPYIRFGRRNVSIPKEEDPLTISRERALELVAAKITQEQNKHIKTLEHEGQTLQILNGRFGPYVSDGSTNASIPKTLVPAELELEQCLELLAKARERKAQRAAKAAAKTTPAPASKTRGGRKKAAAEALPPEDATPKPKRGRKKASPEATDEVPKTQRGRKKTSEASAAAAPSPDAPPPTPAKRGRKKAAPAEA